MVTALRNAIVVSQGGGLYTWKPVCEVCGQWDGSTHDANPPGEGLTQVMSFYCTRCQQTRDAVLTGAGDT